MKYFILMTDEDYMIEHLKHTIKNNKHHKLLQEGTSEYSELFQHIIDSLYVQDHVILACNIEEDEE